jgi:hypothetical protein
MRSFNSNSNKSTDSNFRFSKFTKRFIGVIVVIGVIIGFALYAQYRDHLRLIKYWQSVHVSKALADVENKKSELIPIVLRGPKSFAPKPLVDMPFLWSLNDSTNYYPLARDFIWPGCEVLMNDSYNEITNGNTTYFYGIAENKFREYLKLDKSGLTNFEKGYCVGVAIAPLAFTSLNSSEKLTNLKQEISKKISNANASGVMCEEAIKLDLDWYLNFDGTEKNSQEFANGCIFGVKKTYKYFDRQSTIEQAQKEIQTNSQEQQTSSPTSPNNKNNSSGHWVRTCHWVQVSNPNYDPSNPSINYRLANPPTRSEQQCTDQYIK